MVDIYANYISCTMVRSGNNINKLIYSLLYLDTYNFMQFDFRSAPALALVTLFWTFAIPADPPFKLLASF